MLIQFNTQSGAVTRFQTGLQSVSGTAVPLSDRPGPGDAIGVECVGVDVKFWIRKSGNWVLNQTFTTSTINAGVVGFGVAFSGPTIDAIYGGASVGSSGPSFVQSTALHGLKIGRAGLTHRIF